MPKEIERKFLVINSSYLQLASKSHNIKQGYISANKNTTVRIRIKDDTAFITIKGTTIGFSRDEWEYPIPLCDANEIISNLSCGKIIEKTRYIVNFKGHTWEIDEFHGVHEGLVIAEIELTDEKESFPIPSFVGEEVTGNVNYYNSILAGI